ncbi:peptide chain release factor N(5)-glutamine methyltransferase [Aquabacterium sp. CECT 9606]|uniref:peptide chain release factor N(5)-glutamine methyltransferase n=1 Tax=Aquabacterium sp. CECT 9606 TaxID=2845822 RepID=UPI001E4882F2|nr:peptide chain release factor N(5)-glutamine methyltransferase [Aquabacterium sp. CECT 9606]CAH0347973.1 Release factor glutamine methyltransferase [Aquabacterium sp. CECT 9606]
MDTNHPLFTDRLARLDEALRTLPDKPEETSASALQTLWHLAAGQALSIEAATRQPLPGLTAPQFLKLDELTAQRLGGTPLAHLTGRQHFMGLELLAGPQALIPRSETELLANAALNKLRLLAAERGNDPVMVIDVCTGSGNLALALAHGVPRAQVFAADLSEDAVSLAQRNANHLDLQDRVQLRSGDLLAPFDEPNFHGQVDLLVCNPPYISSGKLETMPTEIVGFEPRLAFDGGPFGIRILQRLMREAPRFLRPGGWLAFEVGLGQGPAVLQWLNKTGHYDTIDSVLDAEGQPRAFLARHKDTA